MAKYAAVVNGVLCEADNKQTFELAVGMALKSPVPAPASVAPLAAAPAASPSPMDEASEAMGEAVAAVMEAVAETAPITVYCGALARVTEMIAKMTGEVERHH